MKLIRPSYEIIEQGPGMQGVYDMIERCGKVSYKSDFKGGEVAKRFVESRAKERHGAVLEFGTVYLTIKTNCPNLLTTLSFYKNNPYSKMIMNAPDNEECIYYYITTNYRVLVENDRLDDLKYLCEPTEFHEKRYAVKFITDIGVGREFLRHRVMSMVQESTRYVNYMKEKFGEECSFIIPCWIPKETLAEGENITWWDGDWVDGDKIKIVKYGAAELEHDPVELWLNHMMSSEIDYRVLINLGWLPQQARTVLPLSTKTEFVLCGFTDAWIHFFCLRSDIAATGKPHPQSVELANPLRDEFIKRQYITEDSLKYDALALHEAAYNWGRPKKTEEK